MDAVGERSRISPTGRFTIFVALLSVFAVSVSLFVMTWNAYKLESRAVPTKFDTPEQLVATLERVAQAAECSSNPKISEQARTRLYPLIDSLRAGNPPDLKPSTLRLSRAPALISCDSPTSQDMLPTTGPDCP